MLRYLTTLLLLSGLAACSNSQEDSPIVEDEFSAEPTNRVVLSSEIDWQQLNPARGDQSPQAGTIWGDRNGTVATGFLAKFVDGFSSPPHIHNVTYRAMVIQGLIHNDDPAAEKMWMPAGSFWTQPAGEVHITAAKGEACIAYVEIDSGPYLVKPIAEASDNGERPVNVDRDNIVWLDATKTTIIESSEATENVAVAFLWENDETKGSLVRLPAGFKGEIVSDGDEFHAVVIEGQSDYALPQSEVVKPLDPGSYFTSTGKSKHTIDCGKGLGTSIYVRTNGEFLVR